MAFEFSRLAENADTRRRDLLEGGQRRGSVRKFLNLISGVLTLLCAGSIAASLTEIVGKRRFEIFALIAAILSGTISLLLSIYFGDDEAKMLGGASDYLSLREALRLTAHDTSLPEKELMESLSSYKRRYGELDRDYSKFFSNRLSMHPPLLSSEVDYLKSLGE